MKFTAASKLGNVKPQWQVNLLLLLLGIVIPLFFLELLARLWIPRPGTVAFIPDPETGFRHQPNQRVQVSNETGEFNTWFTTNNYGDPDLERSMEKPAGVYRIAVLGDSMVEAAQVPLEERFTYLLEQRLTEWARDAGAPFKIVEMMNFGTAGYSTAQEWLNYRSHVRRFDPDLVILFFLPGNDIKNNSYELEVVQSCRPEMAPFYSLSESQELVLVNERFYEKAVARYQKQDRPFPEKVLESARERVRLVDLTYRAYGALRSGSLTNGQAAQLQQEACQTETTLQLFDPNIQGASPGWIEAWEVTGALVNELAREVTSDGARFHVVTATGPWEIQPETRDLVLSKQDQQRYDWELPHQMAADLFDRLGIQHTLLLPGMKKAIETEGHSVHYLYNGHYTSAGHQIVADELFPILQKYLLAE